MAARKKRGAHRRAKAMRFRFEAAGEEQRGISTNVSATGMFLKASYVPARGAMVTLAELYRTQRERAVHLRAEVRWAVSRATLDRPEPGFGVRFAEAWVEGSDPTPLEDFLQALSPNLPATLEKSTRDGAAVVLFTFPELATVETEEAYVEPSEEEALDAIDLAAELGDLDDLPLEDPGPSSRPSTRELVDSPAIFRRPGSSPRAGAPTAAVDHVGVAPSTALTPPRRTGPRRLDSRPRTIGDVFAPAEGDADDAPTRRDPASVARRRRLSGIFTSLFAQEEERDDGARARGAVPEGVQPDVLVRWKDQEAPARIDQISESAVTLVTWGNAPEYYERVTVTPAGHGGASVDVVMFGTVTRIRDAQVNGERAFNVRFSKVDERGKAGLFHEFLRMHGSLP